MANVDTNEHGGWSCYICNTTQDRVMWIGGVGERYYCEACLFNAIRDGKIDIINGSDSSTCDRCKDTDVRCYSCARHDWDLHRSDECDHEYCHDECPSSTCSDWRCYNDAEYFLCSEHLQEARDEAIEELTCLVCGEDAGYHVCIEHAPERVRRDTKPAPASTTAISDDGSTVTVDGITIQF